MHRVRIQRNEWEWHIILYPFRPRAVCLFVQSLPYSLSLLNIESITPDANTCSTSIEHNLGLAFSKAFCSPSSPPCKSYHWGKYCLSCCISSCNSWSKNVSFRHSFGYAFSSDHIPCLTTACLSCWATLGASLFCILPCNWALFASQLSFFFSLGISSNIGR